jgi:hypothetical protein
MAAELGLWEEDGEERESERTRGKKKGRGAWRAGAAPGGSFQPSAASRRWHSGVHAQDTQEVAAYWKKKKRRFCRKPPRVWKIPGKKIKTAHFVRFGDSNGVQKF